ncbi:MAG: hypothetical protein LLG01_16760 [Planctomycetaceae bacterium]|nr:hypothetical protein [Planctomycetaceae bacterium]
MSSIVPAAKLTRQELWMLGENVVHAVDHDGEDELGAVNRSLAVHGESVDSLYQTADRAISLTLAAAPPRSAA